MPDREKVVRGLEVCTVNGTSCNECPYYGSVETIGCVNSIMEDALALLKEQEPVIVRCKNCKYWHDPIRCRLDSEGLKTPDDWFCADGERR